MAKKKNKKKWGTAIFDEAHINGYAEISEQSAQKKLAEPQPLILPLDMNRTSPFLHGFQYFPYQLMQ